jgi:monofunctional biosynthetic peptidoglycan transglycosylase
MRKFFVILACCAGFYLLLFQGFRLLTDVGALEKSFPKVVYDKKDQSSRIELVDQRPQGWAPLGSVSRIAVAAIVLSEDWAFYQHNGFDWEQIRDSIEKNLKMGKFARGGSTITQQVVKNVFLSNEKTLWRKAQEAVLAVRIERRLTKARILEIYLNIAEFGEGLYGIGPAARHYFSKPPSELTAKEGAFLAMLLPSPKKYSVSFRKKELTPYAAATVRSILGKLMATGRLTADEYQIAVHAPLSFEERPMPMPLPDFVPVDEEVVDDQGAATGAAGGASPGEGEGAASSGEE